MKAEIEVVVHDRYLVLGEHYVELDHLSASVEGLAKRSDCILDKAKTIPIKLNISPQPSNYLRGARQRTFPNKIQIKNFLKAIERRQ